MNNNKEFPCYTHKQMDEMMSRIRSWVLNDPSGPLPPLPVVWRNEIPYEENHKTMKESLPEYRKPHKLLALLMWLRIL